MKGTAFILFSTLALTLSNADELYANGCPLDPEIHKILPHDTYCNFFYNCAAGDRVELRCPGELVFNQDEEVCDWPANVDCAGKGINENEPDQGGDGEDCEDGDSNPGGNSDPSTAPEICARADSDGVLVAHEFCNKYYKCDGGLPVAMECNPDLLYNYIKGYCDWPYNVVCGDRIAYNI